MSKIVTLKLEIPCDDDVRTDDVKSAVKQQVRDMGHQTDFGTPSDGQVTADRTAFFGAADVKTWVSEKKRSADAKKGKPNA